MGPDSLSVERQRFGGGGGHLINHGMGITVDNPMYPIAYIYNSCLGQFCYGRSIDSSYVSGHIFHRLIRLSSTGEMIIQRVNYLFY